MKTKPINSQELLFTTREMKAMLGVSDCQLMHLRTTNKLVFTKKGNSFLYELPQHTSLLSHPLGQQLINWFRNKHDIDIDNNPQNQESITALELMISDILIPLETAFGSFNITNGFVSSKLKLFIGKYSPAGTAPQLDQHSASEANKAGKLICERGGSACDIIFDKVPSSEVVRYIVKRLNYDRIYFYGDQRPIHVSVSKEPIQHLQVMKESNNGRRFPAQRAFKNEAILLAESL
ncbi:hypothetical protein [Alteromonas sp. W364]|uniref:hypothetical protein n=1 Tax=Alteromonas sp. W364 TaxID=3075610 RepID=UPI002883A847|nr:hypothetical protein [Alteromonas sp. W364]MDT0628066.1 hypothetical protein [Alteromonas sp. W364]